MAINDKVNTWPQFSTPNYTVDNSAPGSGLLTKPLTSDYVTEIPRLKSGPFSYRHFKLYECSQRRQTIVLKEIKVYNLTDLGNVFALCNVYICSCHMKRKIPLR